MPKHLLLRYVESLQNTLALLTIESSKGLITIPMAYGIKVLDYFYRSNLTVRRIPNSEFLNDTCSNQLNMQQIAFQYYKQRNQPNKPFLVLDFPWLFSTEAKVDLLQVENQLTQQSQMMNGLNLQGGFFNLVHGGGLHLGIEIRRDRILEDSLQKLAHQGPNLRKPLKIKFAGEAGVDAGGVQKEFFSLLVKELFNPQYSMFVVKNVHSYNPRKGGSGSI